MNITLKNVPEPVYRTMKAEAKRNKRSLNAQIIHALEMEAAEARRLQRMPKVMEELARFRASLPLMDDSTPLIRAERERH